jgi:phosphoribosylamine--glycine ligase
MRVLVVGSGGREHALVWKIAQSSDVESVHAAPGSDGIASLAQCHPQVAAGDADGLLALARAESIDLTVIGPEQPLADGLADRLRQQGVAVFGPSAAASRLEASKAWAKDFMQRHATPTAAFASFDTKAAALAYVREIGGPCVVKADGLAAGKGVVVCDGPDDACAALEEIMGDRRFGAAGDRVVIEERLVGEEASYYAISDGEHVLTLAAAQDHKRALDGDLGENTGGMGAYAPAPVVTEAVEKRILEEVVHPAIRGMAADGHPYQGVLFVGLMIEADGTPKVIEFNVRFGDPETQPLMVQMQSDLVPLLDGAARGTLDRVAPPRFHGAAVCVVLAAGGYPRAFEKGLPIEGLEEASAREGVVIFHAGTVRSGTGFATSGGRVLGVTASGVDVKTARDRAYAAVRCVRFEGAHYRRDIAARALER